MPEVGGFIDKKTEHPNAEIVKKTIIQSLGLKPKTLAPPIAVVPTAPWDEMYPEDLTEYIIEITSLPYACFRAEAPTIIEPYLEKVKEAVKNNSILPNSPWYVPNHSGLYSQQNHSPETPS